MKKRKNFRKKRPKDDSVGLSVKVWNNNVEGALKIFKRKVKDSNLMLDLKKKAYYEKPSEIKRHKKNLAKLRTKYAIEKEKAKKNY
jgi:small subunit ribosomal protein S21